MTSLCSDQSAEGRLGPQPVVLDHTSGFEGLLFVDDDLLGVSRVPMDIRKLQAVLECLTSCLLPAGDRPQ